MQSTKKTRMLLGIAWIAVAAGSLGAAQGPTDLVGSFTLPSQVRWQTAVLPAGSYKFTMDRNGSNTMITIRQGTKGVAMIVLQAFSEASTQGKSSMLIVDHRVRSLHLAPAGATYVFPAHRNERERLEVGASALAAAVIPVSVK